MGTHKKIMVRGTSTKEKIEKESGETQQQKSIHKREPAHYETANLLPKDL